MRVLARWREAGVVEAPAYLVGDEVFIGRAHLPMIEWIYQARKARRRSEHGGPRTQVNNQGDRVHVHTPFDAADTARSPRWLSPWS